MSIYFPLKIYPNHMFGWLWAGWCSWTLSTWNINATTKHTRVLLSFRILKFNLFPAVQCFDFIRLAISTQFDVAFIVMRSVCRSLTYGLSVVWYPILHDPSGHYFMRDPVFWLCGQFTFDLTIMKPHNVSVSTIKPLDLRPYFPTFLIGCVSTD